MSHTHPEPAAARANRLFRLLRVLGRGLFRSLFALEVEGLDRVPASGGYVLACNHLSWIDPLLLMACLPAEPRIHFVAAAEYTVAGPWPIPLLVKRVGGIIPVDRQSQKGNRAAIQESLRVVRGGGVLGIFPEGRCGEAEGHVLPLKEGAAAIAAKTGSPVLVAGLSGTLDLYLRRRIRLRIGPVLVPGPAETQAELLARVAEAMEKTIPPVNPDQPRRKWMAWLSRLF